MSGASLPENWELSVTSSSVTARTAFLAALDPLIAQLSDQELISLTRSLLSTFNYYQDAKSRTQVTKLLMKVVVVKPELLPQCTKFISQYAQSSKSQSINGLLTLLEWVNELLKIQVSVDLIHAQGSLLVKCLDYAVSEGKQHKKRVKHSCLAQVRSSLTHCASSISNVEIYITTLTDPKVTMSLLLKLALLGSLCLASLDSIPFNPQFHDLLKSKKPPILEFFNKEVLSSKTLPEFAFSVFVDGFVSNFVESLDLNAMLPSLEKSSMRSSEFTFGSVTPILISEIPSNLDISTTISSSKIFPLLISGLKSSKEVTRDGSVKTLECILARSSNSDDACVKMIDELVKALKTTSNLDQKQLFARVLLKFIPSSTVSVKICESVLPLIIKDQNELTLKSFLETFFSHYFQILSSQWDSKNFQELVLKGLQDKKLNLRKVWFLAMGESLISYTSFSTELLEFLSTLLPIWSSTTNEITANPLLSVTAKGIESAYVSLALIRHLSLQEQSSELVKDQISLFTEVLKNDEKPSIITNSRVYGKLTTNDEKVWFEKLVFSCIDQLPSGDVILHLTLSEDIPPSLKRVALDDLASSIAKQQQRVGDLVSESLFQLLKANNLEENKLDINYVPSLLNILTQSGTDKDVTAKHVCDLLVISHAVHVKGGWVGVLQRAQVDPGMVVNKYGEEIVTKLSTEMLGSSKLFVDNAVKSLSTILFISPELISPMLAQIIENDLSTERLINGDETSIQIWKLSDEDQEPVVDVLTNGKKQEVDKNSKDYETRKWEESVRLQVKSKKASTKKLTKEEIALVNEQLSKEKEIRHQMNILYNHLTRGIAIIQGLVKDVTVDNGKSSWFPIAVNSLLSIIPLKITESFLNDSAIATFLSLSDLLSVRLGPTRLFLGVATLRSLGISSLPENLMAETTTELILRVLFKVKFLGVQSLLDSISLVYILPLLIDVLKKGKEFALKNSKTTISTVKTEFVEEDPEEEKLMLSMEIISTHAEEFQNDSIPRSDILEALLSLLALPSKLKLAKECLSMLCLQISVNISDHDLDIILAGCIKREEFVRSTILELLDTEFELTSMSYSNEIWIAVHDNNSNNAEVAATIWEENHFKLDNSCPEQLMLYLHINDGGVRLSVCKAIATAITHLSENDSSIFDKTLDQLLLLYDLKAKPPPPVLDLYGLVIKSSTEQKDPWEERSGVALTSKHIAHLFTTEESVSKFFKFLTEYALGDKEPLVRQEFQDAGVEIINVTGFHFIEALIPIFENVLSAKDEGSKTQDNIRESVIILYGSLARHLDSSDPRLDRVVNRLIKTLDTPSEDVQFAVSECIAPLVVKFEPRIREYFDDLMKKLFESKTLAVRRGAAYGIAGLVKGAGIVALANYDIIRNLIDASEDKKDAKRRESVSFVIECLSQSLGKYFEPYVIEILPNILKLLGDSNTEVREATDYATRVIMKNTTSFGVKKMIPLAILNLDDILWRTKRGSVELLGSMAYLDPTQLSSSLSTIVPEIVAVLNDSHKEVRKSADLALKRFGEVIRNPEIQTLVPMLIKAIGDPTKYTDEALDALIKTQFVHYIDGPSLALIIHVIHRGMHDRSASTKRKACQIVGNMSILVDSKDLITYLPELVSELEVSMVDPVPTTRATAARALGSLVEKLGEDQFPDLIPRLLRTLQDEEKAGDRLGSAQALSEIISALGTSKLEEMLPTILSNASSSRPYVRAGFMPLLLFLPVCFGMQFSSYLDRVIPVILEGLAAEDEVRETALKAARLIVKNYATKAVDLLLPELERGLSDFSYRIRLSSVELTGDLLFQITGISGKLELANDDEDDQIEYSGIGQLLIQVLGQERRDRVLASLFVCRQDVSALVRNATVDIWKALVANTPRTVKEILPTLTTIIIRHLASPDETQRTIAAQTLGEMVRRVGSNALPSLLPTLEEQLVSSDSDAKQGICIAVRELIESSSTDVVKDHQDDFVNIVRDALVDPNESVREAAASAFDILQDAIGDAAVDEIIPQLLNKLSSDDSENALLALQDIMSTKSDVIFPILIPSLLSPPIDAFKAGALASLAEVAGSALYKRLSVIINALVDRLLVVDGETDEIKASFDKILLSVTEDEGLHPLLQQLLSLIKHEDADKRAVIYERLAPFFKDTHLDYSIYTLDILTHCIMALDDRDPGVVQSAFSGLTELVKRQSKESLEKLVKPARQTLSITGVPGTDLAGFALPKGPNCILPIFLHGLMYGTTDQREASALGIADIVEKTPAANLKPFVTVMVGPLIRVIGERFSGDVKAAILYALNMLFAKIPQFLRPFVPQLQRTFVKSLSDSSNELLRSRAARALGTLIEFQPRVDPLVAELVGGAKQATDIGVRTAMLKALLEVVHKAGSKMNETSKLSVMNLVEEEISNADEKMAVAYARLVGSLSKILTHDELIKVLRAKVLDAVLEGNPGKFAVLTLNAFLRDSPSHIFETGLVEEIGGFIISCCRFENAYISDKGVLAAGKFLLLHQEVKSPFSNEAGEPFEIPDEMVKELMDTLSVSMCAPLSSSTDTRRLSLLSIRTVARFKFEEIIKPNIDSLLPSVFTCVRDIIIPIKLAAEKLYLAIFNLVEDQNLEFFNEWFGKLSGSSITTITGQTLQLRSIGDYTKRVAVRLANVERERIAAGGDAEAMFSDRYEDETEIWAVGGVDLETK